MTHAEWKQPEFRELNLSAEIGMYAADGDDPHFDARATDPRESNPLNEQAPDACA